MPPNTKPPSCCIAPRGPDAAAIRERVNSFAEAGCGELVFIPCDADPGQVDLLADALP